jgi:hypothetical protein
MNKQIISIGYQIPGKHELCISFDKPTSLMDADILLISPESLIPWRGWVTFGLSDGGCYNVESSNTYKQNMSHLKKEIEDHLKVGKNIFILLNKEEINTLASGTTSPRKGQTLYSTYNYSNYGFLPIDIGQLTTASGKHIQFSGNPIFNDFYNKFKSNLKYELYIEGVEEANVIFTGKDKSKILGATYSVGKGNIITLPILTYNEEEFTEIGQDEDGEEREYWNKKGVAFGNNFTQCLLEIDKKLNSDSDKTAPPDWASKKQFIGKKEKQLKDTINDNNKKIEKITLENENLKTNLEKENILKGLLFEQGKPLEGAVIKALKILGYEAENYDDGDLEMDQVIINPEKHRYIGETEGKDNKDINITKFRQLVDVLNEDFAREEVTEKAFGILFGNAERLTDPNERKLDFTDKCKSGAKREKIALIKTTDLFTVVKYINENDDEKFKKGCRDAIHGGLGKIVKFPKIPNK